MELHYLFGFLSILGSCIVFFLGDKILPASASAFKPVFSMILICMGIVIITLADIGEKIIEEIHKPHKTTEAETKDPVPGKKITS